ncbi:MAG: hypothetical protein NUV69_03770 [Candidatus Curtissbacteria bacterium]|nr:hypothetical protein [Candidatus Curtissbacteria bacterium]
MRGERLLRTVAAATVLAGAAHFAHTETSAAPVHPEPSFFSPVDEDQPRAQLSHFTPQELDQPRIPINPFLPQIENQERITVAPDYTMVEISIESLDITNETVINVEQKRPDPQSAYIMDVPNRGFATTNKKDGDLKKSLLAYVHSFDGPIPRKGKSLEKLEKGDAISILVVDRRTGNRSILDFEVQKFMITSSGKDNAWERALKEDRVTDVLELRIVLQTCARINGNWLLSSEQIEKIKRTKAGLIVDRGDMENPKVELYFLVIGELVKETPLLKPSLFGER